MHSYGDILPAGPILVCRLQAVRQKKPLILPVAAHSVEHVLRSLDFDIPVVVERANNRFFFKRHRTGDVIQRADSAFRIRQRIDMGRTRPQKDQSSSVRAELLQRLDRTASQRFAGRHDYGAVRHFTDVQASVASGRRVVLLRQQGLADIIEINICKQQPARDILEIRFDLISYRSRFPRGPPVQPVAFHRMDYRDVNEGSAAYQRSIQSGKMVLHIFIFFVPGGLIADRRRIIAFGFSRHRHPG